MPKLIEQTEKLDLHHLDGTFFDAKVKLDELAAKYGAHARFNIVCTDYECYDMIVTYKRPELPHEKKARLARQRRKRAAAKGAVDKKTERELITLRQLIKKHGIPAEEAA